jgi:histidinol-phosphate aminotransferase
VPYALLSPALREAGIQLRDARSFGLPGHVRLAVLPPASQAALAQAWQAARA